MEAAARDVQAKGFACTSLEQQRLPARGLGGSCREEAVQQLEVEAAARELEPAVCQGFKGFKRLKPGKRAGLNALTREGYVQAKGRLQCWNADGQELGGSCREGCAGKGQLLFGHSTLELQTQRLTARGSFLEAAARKSVLCSWRFVRVPFEAGHR